MAGALLGLRLAKEVGLRLDEGHPQVLVLCALTATIGLLLGIRVS
jgi:hypothetical protein